MTHCDIASVGSIPVILLKRNVRRSVIKLTTDAIT